MLTFPSFLVSVVDVSIMRMGGHQLPVGRFALALGVEVAAFGVEVEAGGRMPAVVVVVVVGR